MTPYAEVTCRVCSTRTAAIASLEAVDAEALEAGLARTIEIPHRGAVMTYCGDQFITRFAIPNFFFYPTTAYAILRHEGVPLQNPSCAP